MTTRRLATSARGLAAVDDDDRAGHEGGCVRGEVDEGGAELVGLADAAERNLAHDLGADLRIVERGGVQIGAEIPGSERVDGDAVARPLDGEGAREGDDGAFGGG